MGIPTHHHEHLHPPLSLPGSLCLRHPSPVLHRLLWGDVAQQGGRGAGVLPLPQRSHLPCHRGGADGNVTRGPGLSLAVWLHSTEDWNLLWILINHACMLTHLSCV